MTVRQIIEKMGDYSISSEEIFEMIKAFLASQDDSEVGEISPAEKDIIEYGQMMSAVNLLRPSLGKKRLWRYIMEPNPSCPVHGMRDQDLAALEKKLFPDN